MKTQVVNRKIAVSVLTMFGFAFLVLLVLPTTPAWATDFEIGTRFGISHLRPLDEADDSRITITAIPSGSPGSLYATWFPSKQFAIGPEFSFGRITNSWESWQGERESSSINSLYLGGQAAYYLHSHAMSSPYLLGRVNFTIASIEDDTNTLLGLGTGLGYQWRIGPALVLRLQGQVQLISGSENDSQAMDFGLVIGLGTRFGNGNNPTP